MAKSRIPLPPGVPKHDKTHPPSLMDFICAAIEQYCPGADGHGIYAKGFERWQKWCAEQSRPADNPLHVPSTSTLLPKMKRPTAIAPAQPQSTANKPGGT